jgi:hypothetical protein
MAGGFAFEEEFGGEFVLLEGTAWGRRYCCRGALSGLESVQSREVASSF